MKKVSVVAEKTYDVLIDADWKDSLVTAISHRSRAAFIVSKKMRDRISDMPSMECEIHYFEIPDGEEGKSIKTLMSVWDWLGAAGFTRSDVIVGIGGGATTDFAGYAAASWLRGIDWIAVPTTLAGMVDALGGIDVCTKRDIDDPNSHLVLKAGAHTLDGIEALKYVRTRDFDGMGDLGRMQRQQQFMSAVLRKVTSSGVLLNPIKLVNFFNATIATVRTDSELNRNDLIVLAKQLKNLSPSKVRTLTIPLGNANARVPGLGSVVTWDSVLAPDLFNRLREDLPLVDEVTPSPSASSSASASPTVIDKFKTRTADENPCGALK